MSHLPLSLSQSLSHSLPQSLSPSLTSKRFFLTYYKTFTHPPYHPHPRIPPPPTLHHRRPASTSHRRASLHHRRRASTTTTTNPPPQTHYALFPHTLPHGPPPTGPFALDPRALRAEYLQLQRQYHPDTLHRASPAKPSLVSKESESEEEKEEGSRASLDLAKAEGTSAYISHAYRTLLSPLHRAQYLLSLRGVEVSESAKAGHGHGEAELLMDVMGVREEIEGAAGEGEIRGLEGENEGRIGECEGLLGEMFRRDDLEGARGVVVRLRYWVNVREALGRWEKGGEVVLVH